MPLHHDTDIAQEEPKWTPYARSAETEVNSYRQDYVKQYLANETAVA